MDEIGEVGERIRRQVSPKARSTFQMDDGFGRPAHLRLDVSQVVQRYRRVMFEAEGCRLDCSALAGRRHGGEAVGEPRSSECKIPFQTHPQCSRIRWREFETFVCEGCGKVEFYAVRKRE